jgi:aspartate/methionine/tyrosine aminotransferase
MNEIELTQLFIEYAETQSLLDELRAKIEAEILERKDSVKIAGVKATYYKPSAGTPKYEESVIEYLGSHPEKKDELKKFQSTIISTSWKEALLYFNLIAKPGDERPAKVVIK